MVCGAVLELVKVLETIPYGPVDPRDGAIAANAGAETKRSAANSALATRLKRLRGILNLHFSNAADPENTGTLIARYRTGASVWRISSFGHVRSGAIHKINSGVI